MNPKSSKICFNFMLEHWPGNQHTTFVVSDRVMGLLTPDKSLLFLSIVLCKLSYIYIFYTSELFLLVINVNK